MFWKSIVVTTLVRNTHQRGWNMKNTLTYISRERILKNILTYISRERIKKNTWIVNKRTLGKGPSGYYEVLMCKMLATIICILNLLNIKLLSKLFNFNWRYENNLQFALNFVKACKKKCQLFVGNRRCQWPPVKSI